MLLVVISLLQHLVTNVPLWLARNADTLQVLHTTANLVIAVSYVAISTSIAVFAWKSRGNLPFSWVFPAFGMFIITCAGTHFVHAFEDLPGLSGTTGLLLAGIFIHAACVGISVVTAVLLPFVVPQAVRTVNEAKVSEERRVKLEQANDELTKLYAHLKGLDEVKTNFFANVSHELRTPLALILGPTRNLLSSAPISDDQREALEVIERNAQTLLARVTDLLDIAQLDVGKLEVIYSSVDLEQLVRVTVAHFDAIARERQINLTVDAEPTPAQVDSAKVQRILLNLLSNAFKFVPNGGAIRGAVKSVDGVVGITVDDSGPGVPEPLRASIFDRFWKGEPSAKRLSGGTGLGLAIVREFVELHRGSVDVSTSDLGGARFTVRLPASAPPHASVVLAAEIPLDPSAIALSSDVEGDNRGLTAPAGIVGEGDGLVLVVEDHPDMRKYLVDSLAKGHRVAAAVNGREGLKLVEQLRPDLIVSDLMMPDVDGESLLRDVRKNPLNADVAVLIVSARSDSEIRERFLRAGAQDFVVKPFSIVELRARVDYQIQAKLTRDVLRRELTTHQSDLVALARELSERNRELRRAVAARDDFLSSAAHELKTPLAVLVLQAQLIARKAASHPSVPVDPDRIDSILVTVGKLDTLVVELLDITRADNGRLVGKREGVGLSGLICQVSEERQSSKHRFVVDVDGPLHASVDRVRIKQLLVNLMDNAAKYSPAGGEVAVTGRQSDGVIHLEVTDHGIGIPAGELPCVFDRLRRASNVDDRRFVGMGLGLYISRAIVEQHGGRIWATSDGPGRGTTIHVDLPVDESLDSSPEAPSIAA